MDTDLIKVVNRLQETFSAIGGDSVDLPQCVVVGSQSSGKSSVLETIVGKDFLPRGAGIVTRRPLVLQLVHNPVNGNGSAAPASASGYSVYGGYSGSAATQDGGNLGASGGSNGNGGNPNVGYGDTGLGGGGGMGASSSSSAANNTTTTGGPGGAVEWGEFLHLDRRFTDFGEMRREIENETFRVAGQNKGISKLPIHLKIFSPNVLNLTLVDLPGLTKIPVGDQPSDIERQIHALVTSYISKPNCIIIAVSPANVDLANSDSLKLARAVDPQGRRTIGVLTKLDLMDNGTHALDILTGRVYPLKLGFIGVVNRSQHDINANLPLAHAKRAEEEFFRTHIAYRNIAHRCGTRYLAKTLNQVLMAHIRDKLPDMKARLNTLMGQTQQELATFGDTSFMGEHNRGTLILKLMTQFARDFVASIDGTSFDISTKELCGGARVYYIFNDVFGQALDSINPTSNLTVQDIRTAIRNSTGPRPSLFVPEQAFELLIKPQIKLLEPPSLRCVELVYEELMKICHNCTSTELQRFPRLHAELIEVVSELLRERLGPTSEYVQSLIAIQAAYINTNHPAFVQDSANIARQTREGSARKPHLIKPPPESSLYDSDSQAGNITEEDDEDARANGYSTHNERGTSSGLGTGQDPSLGTTGGATGHRGGRRSHGGHQHAATIGHAAGFNVGEAHRDASAAAAAAAAAANGGRDGFLHYFFGGASLPAASGGMGAGAAGSAAAAAAAASAGAGVPPALGTSTSQRGAFAEFGDPLARERRLRSNPMAGRVGLEGSSAAYDMKSLDKHLEATPLGGGLGGMGGGRGFGATAAAEMPGLSERELLETNLIRSLIASYFSIVRQSVADLVPKATMHLLVNFAKEEVSTTLVRKIFTQDPERYAELLEEDSNVRRERQRVEALLATYREAFNILSEVTFKA